jgi:hypothetical protein
VLYPGIWLDGEVFGAVADVTLGYLFRDIFARPRCLWSNPAVKVVRLARWTVNSKMSRAGAKTTTKDWNNIIPDPTCLLVHKLSFKRDTESSMNFIKATSR